MPASFADAPPALRLSHVSAGYGSRAVLADLSITVAQGEAYALLGPNGAGKSTAARVACGLLNPSSGRVDVAGLALAGARGRGRIGLAPQDCALFSALTIRENLNVMAELGGVARAARSEAVARALALASCTDRADERVSALSGGWRRRANLAAALVCRPTLLVLDEPTEGVDARTRTTLVLAVRAALAEGAGCLIISHDAAFVAATATRIGILAEGRLVAEGVAPELLGSTFGAAGRLSVRFEVAPPDGVREQLAAQGMLEEGDGVTWRRIGTDVEHIAEALSGLVQDCGGELILRRPDLDDLLAQLTGRPG
ncbi:MAG: ABC transporter ATP-binding protein [Brevundimonas sp.]